MQAAQRFFLNFNWLAWKIEHLAKCSTRSYSQLNKSAHFHPKNQSVSEENVIHDEKVIYTRQFISSFKSVGELICCQHICFGAAKYTEDITGRYYSVS